MKTESEIAGQVAESKLLALCPAGIHISRVGLQVTDCATQESIQALDALLEEVGGSMLYLWGDYLNYLFRAQGEKFARSRMAGSYSPETMRFAAWVCRRVTPERRLLAPSFSHAKEVAQLEPTEQELWLSRAAEEKWSQKELRSELRQAKAQISNAGNQGPIDQRAARAWQGWETFCAWYQSESPAMSPEARAESNQALRPFVMDYMARASDDELQIVMEARALYQDEDEG